MESLELLDAIYKWGALPLLCVMVWVLWKKVTKHETSIEVLNEAQKADIRNHADEVKGLQQNTLNTLNELSKRIKE